MELLDGKLLSEKVRSDLGIEVKKLADQGHRAPHLVAVLIGDNPASQTYVNSKIKSCAEIGYGSTLFRYETITEKELLELIDSINANDDIDGVIVQLPLPKDINEHKVIERIDPSKDVDGFHPTNIGKMVLNLPCPLPATPKGMLEFLKHYNIETAGKHCVVVGRSNIVGTPMVNLMSRKGYPGNCTVSVVHSYTKNLPEITRQADILVAAIGIPHFIKADMVKDGVVVLDVGINSIPDATKKSGFRLVGDVDFENVAPKCSYITPVPGGVGLMTVAALMQNTLVAYKMRKNIS
jgi:methylenetetrahydrofolate dehydrogenase (NADP+)/methenyltetrahydrofolate cyclohydrolase